MYIELYGIPGVGKTTTCDELVKAENYIKIKKIKNLKEINFITAIKTIPKYLSIMNYIYNEYCRTMFINITKKERSVFRKSLFVCLYHYYDTYDKKEVYVTDHGIIQSLAENSFLLLYDRIIFWKNLLHLLPSKNNKSIQLDLLPYDVMFRAKKRSFEEMSTYARDMNDLSTYMLFFERIGREFNNSITVDASKKVNIIIKNIIKELK